MTARPKIRAAWFWGTLLVIAISILVMRALTSPRGSAVVLYIGLSVLVVLVVGVVVSWFYNRPVARARKADPSAWVHFCEDLRAPMSRRFLRVDEVGVWVLDAHGATVNRWPYEMANSTRAAAAGNSVDRRPRPHASPRDLTVRERLGTSPD